MPYNRRLFTQLLAGTTASWVIPGKQLRAARQSNDLAVDALQWSEDLGDTWNNVGAVADGSSVLFQTVVRNIGHMGVPFGREVRVDFHVDEEVIDTVVYTDGFAVGQEVTVTSITPWPAVAGSYLVGVIVDPADLIKSEESEGNNRLSVNLQVIGDDMLAVAAAGEPEICELTDEQKKLAKVKGKADDKEWKKILKDEMKGRMVTEEGIDPLRAEEMATLAVASLQGLGSLISTAISIVGATMVGGPAGGMLALGSAILTAPLGPRDLPNDGNQAVGYSSSTGGNLGIFPTTVTTMTNTQLPGTTPAKSVRALETFGFAPRWADSSGNFDNSKIYGTGGKVQLYGGHIPRLGALFSMYFGTMKMVDAWNLSLYTTSFKDQNGAVRSAGGHSNPNFIGGMGGTFYAYPMGHKCFGRAVTEQPTLTELYTICLHMGFRNYPLSTGSIHGNIPLGTLHHVSSLGAPTHSMPTPSNGDPLAAIPRDGIHTAHFYSKQVNVLLPRATVSSVIDTCCRWSRTTNVALPTPILIMIIWRLFQFLISHGAKLVPIVDDIMLFLARRGITENRTNVTRFVTDILLGTLAEPELRRFLLDHLLTRMDSGLGGPALTVDTAVYQATGTGPFPTSPPPTVTEYQDVIDIYDDWKSGLIPAGRRVFINTSGRIVHN